MKIESIKNIKTIPNYHAPKPEWFDIKCEPTTIQPPNLKEMNRIWQEWWDDTNYLKTHK